MGDKTFQFNRLYGYPRGPVSGRGTVRAIMAEGLREPTHISHLPGDTRYRVVPLDGPESDPSTLASWIENQMDTHRNIMYRNGRKFYRKVRCDALAIGTMITSLPETMDNYDETRFTNFANDTTEWAREFLNPLGYMLHYRVEHLDERHPHLHLWFTPRPEEGNWSFNNLFGETKKVFFHDFQKKFFEGVGYKYFDERARPFNERKQRIPRHFAVKERDNINAKDPTIEDILDVSNLANEKNKEDVCKNLDRILAKLDDADVERIPTVARRLIYAHGRNETLGENHEEKLSDTCRALEESREEIKYLKQLLEENVGYSGGDGSKVLHEKGSNKSDKNVPAGITHSNWEALTDCIFSSAQRNINRSVSLRREDWEELVVEDALDDIVFTDILRTEDIDYWLHYGRLAMELFTKNNMCESRLDLDTTAHAQFFHKTPKR